MDVITNVRKLNNEAFEKWFEECFDKGALIKEISEQASKGYDYYIISLNKTSNTYYKNFLSDRRTRERLAEWLGEGFSFKFNIFTGLEISW